MSCEPEVLGVARSVALSSTGILQIPAPSYLSEMTTCSKEELLLESPPVHKGFLKRLPVCYFEDGGS